METESLKVSADDLLAECRNLWRLACEHEGTPAHAAFAVFSPNNPFAQAPDETMGRLLSLRAIAAGEVELVPIPGPQPSTASLYTCDDCPDLEVCDIPVNVCQTIRVW